MDQASERVTSPSPSPKIRRRNRKGLCATVFVRSRRRIIFALGLTVSGLISAARAKDAISGKAPNLCRSLLQASQHRIWCRRSGERNHRALAEEPQHDVHVSGFRRRTLEQQQCGARHQSLRNASPRDRRNNHREGPCRFSSLVEPV